MELSLGKANLGRSLEITILASQRGILCVDKFNASAKWLRGGRTIQVKGPVDFVGEVVATGRAIHFDAKTTQKAKGFYIGCVEPHQYQHLARHHAAGALAGIVAECTAIGRYYWIGFKQIDQAHRAGVACIPWEAAACLGVTTHLINFSALPGVNE